MTSPAELHADYAAAAARHIGSILAGNPIGLTSHDLWERCTARLPTSWYCSDPAASIRAFRQHLLDGHQHWWCDRHGLWRPRSSPPTASPTPAPPPPPPTHSQRPRTTLTRVLGYLRAHPQGATPAQMSQDWGIHPPTLYAALSRYAIAGQIRRLAPGVYGPPNAQLTGPR